MNVDAISRQVGQLPAEGQRQVLDFVAFLKSRLKTPVVVPRKGSIADEPFIGMWKDREDMEDSAAWVKEVRRREWARA